VAASNIVQVQVLSWAFSGGDPIRRVAFFISVANRSRLLPTIDTRRFVGKLWPTMELHGHPVGVCSWSLRPKDVSDLIAQVRAADLSHVQLALAPFLDIHAEDRDRDLGLIKDAGLSVTATMISYPGEDYSSIAAIKRTGGLIPDDLWPARRELTLRAASLSRALGCKCLTTHVGFIPPPNDAMYPTVVQRILELTKPLAEIGVDLLMETGQEPADELLQFINNVPAKNLGVNFDPANMLLYGSGDPVEAIGILGKRIRHVHVKDAVKSDNPGTDWGEEVPFGDGEVPHASFLAALRAVGYTGPLVIEREAGNERLADVKYAMETLAGL
jgi:L-ribulose-5-phosphate 3-epimerase